MDTPLKLNKAPEKWWLEGYFPIGKVTFQGRAVKLREGNSQVPGSLQLRGATHTVGPCKLKIWKHRSDAHSLEPTCKKTLLKRTCILKNLDFFRVLLREGVLFLMASCIYHHGFPIFSSPFCPPVSSLHPFCTHGIHQGNLFVSQSHLQGAKQQKKTF